MADFERKVNERMGKLELEVHDLKSTLDTMKSEIVDEVKEIIGNPTHSVKGIQSGDINRDSADTIIKVALYKDIFPPIFHLKTAVTFLILHQN